MRIDIDIIPYSYSIFLYIRQLVFGDFEVPAICCFYFVSVLLVLSGYVQDYIACGAKAQDGIYDEESF